MARPVLRSWPGRIGAVVLAFTLSACAQDQTAPTPPLLGRAAELLTAADSAAALQSGGGSVSPQSHQSSGVVAIHAGETAVVTVASVSTARCESVGVSGVISQALFGAVGSCGGAGLSTTIGPAPADGELFFSLTTSPSSQSQVEGRFPDYTVGLDDGLFDFDFNDVVLSVAVQEVVPLRLQCLPANPTRGETVTCTASLGTPAPFTIVRRLATGSGFRTEQTTPIPHGAGETDVWAGEAVATTDVTVDVEVTDGGRTRQLTARSGFTVTPRAWPVWQFTNVIGPFIALAGRMTPTPQRNTPIGLSQPEVPAAADIPVTLPAGGPNVGLAFVTDRVILDGWLVGIHPALEPTPAGLVPGDPGYMPWHAWYDDQNGQGGGTCGPADILRLRQEVERHEGLTQAPNSHLGVANTVLLNEQPQARIERLYSDESEQALRDLIDAAFREFFNGGPYERAQREFDRVDTRQVFDGLGCSLDFNLRNP